MIYSISSETGFDDAFRVSAIELIDDDAKLEYKQSFFLIWIQIKSGSCLCYPEDLLIDDTSNFPISLADYKPKLS